MLGRVKLFFSLFLISALMVPLNLIGEDGEKVAKPKQPHKPPAEIKDLELAGVVIKTVVKEGVTAFQLKKEDGKLVALPTKIGAEDAKLEQFVDKTVIVKGKGTSEVRKTVKGDDYTSIHLRQLTSIELKPEAAGKDEKKKEVEKKPDDKPAEKKEEEKK